MTKSGFTLVEILVATAILVIIVLIISTVFHQSSLAWDAGTRKAEGGMTARAVLGFMAREMSAAVADTNILTESLTIEGLGESRNEIIFITLAEEPDSGKHIARRITYDLDSENVIWRECAEPDPWGVYGEWEPNPTRLMLITNVCNLRFYAAGGGRGYQGSLPEYVRIVMGVYRSDDVSGVGALSSGPNRTFGDSDDIESW